MITQRFILKRISFFSIVLVVLVAISVLSAASKTLGQLECNSDSSDALSESASGGTEPCQDESTVNPPVEEQEISSPQSELTLEEAPSQDPDTTDQAPTDVPDATEVIQTPGIVVTDPPTATDVFVTEDAFSDDVDSTEEAPTPTITETQEQSTPDISVTDVAPTEDVGSTEEAPTPGAAETDESPVTNPCELEAIPFETEEAPLDPGALATEEAPSAEPCGVTATVPPESEIQVFASNSWAVGNTVGLCQGTEIRTGPGNSFPVHTVVPENDWAVVVKGGPTDADGHTWWDIDRGAAGDPSGGTGWVRQDQADCQGGGGDGGDDNSTPGHNVWKVGNDAYLCQGTIIRQAPSDSAQITVTVPEANWKVVIKGGPTDADGHTWWDIDRGAAGDPSGGTGWVRQDQADCQAPGGGNSTPGNNIWQVGNDAYLCQGTQIRTGPGLSFNVHTVVPENDWKVVIKGGPTQADGHTWWDIDRGAAGDPSGGTGWVRQDQADCQGGGDDNSTPGNNIWQVGNDAYLCQGTQIRMGPGLSFSVHTVVPENDWKVVIKGGPTDADGHTWWDIDRGAAGDPSGGTGWIRQDQADCTAPGGDDNSTTEQNVWRVGNDAYLCQGTAIRTGPNISFSVHTVVPENDWKVVIIGGPEQANGLTWWNIDRAAAGDPSGGTGWVIQLQADCQPFTPIPDEPDQPDDDPMPQPGEVITPIPSPEDDTQSTPPTSGQGDNQTACNNMRQVVSVGDHAGVYPGGGAANRLREVAGLDGQVVTLIHPGSEFDVIEGPVCVDGYVWWRVAYNGQRGWIAQGSSTVDWIEWLPTNQPEQPMLCPVSARMRADLSNLDEQLRTMLVTGIKARILPTLENLRAFAVAVSEVPQHHFILHINLPSSQQGSIESFEYDGIDVTASIRNPDTGEFDFTSVDQPYTEVRISSRFWYPQLGLGILENAATLNEDALGQLVLSSGFQPEVVEQRLNEVLNRTWTVRYSSTECSHQ